MASSENDIGGPFSDGVYDLILKHKEKNTQLKVLLAVGGWAFGSKPFRELTQTLFRINGFAYNSVHFLRENKFDGMSIDWEFPESAEDKESFVALIKKLRLAFEEEAKSSRKSKLLLTAAVPANYEVIDVGYDVPELTKYLDYFSVMAYDFHGSWEGTIGHNSPLFPLESANSTQKKLTVDSAAKEWTKRGAPLEKLIIGMPAYGRTFTLANQEKFDIGDEALGGGKNGKYTGEEGFLSYYEICDFLHEENTTLVWDNEQQVSFAYHGNQWVGFDDELTVQAKMDWLKEEGFGGVMIWSVDLDDFRGYCGNGKYPLLKAIKRELKGHSLKLVYDGPFSTPAKNNHDGAREEEEEHHCDDNVGHASFHRDKNDCKKYYVCQGKHKHHKTCPTGLVFNQEQSACDWPSAVEECAGQG